MRVAGLKDQEAAGISGTGPDGLSVTDQLQRIRTEVESLFERRQVAFLDDILPRLADTGVRVRTRRRSTTRIAPGSRKCSSSGSFRC